MNITEWPRTSLLVEQSVSITIAWDSRDIDIKSIDCHFKQNNNMINQPSTIPDLIFPIRNQIAHWHLMTHDDDFNLRHLLQIYTTISFSCQTNSYHVNTCKYLFDKLHDNARNWKMYDLKQLWQYNDYRIYVCSYDMKKRNKSKMNYTLIFAAHGIFYSFIFHDWIFTEEKKYTKSWVSLWVKRVIGKLDI